MAEIGLVASIIGVVGAGTKLSIAIFDFASDIGNAGKELQNIAAEVSDVCLVLEQLQSILKHAHFRPSTVLLESVERIAKRCKAVFDDINDIVNGLHGSRKDDVFPQTSPDLIAKVKYALKKSKVQLLRSNMESCKSTLNVMLTILGIAEQRSQSGPEEGDGRLEQSKAMTQSLVIAQQCAVEKLEHIEDEIEQEEEAAALLPGVNVIKRSTVSHRRKSRGRLAHMFSGLSVTTALPMPRAAPLELPGRTERASVWLDDILAAPDEPIDPHPGRRKQKRMSSAKTANATSTLLRKWTDQAGPHYHPAQLTAEQEHPENTNEMWQNQAFAFPTHGDHSDKDHAAGDGLNQMVRRASTDLVSPKTARVHSINYQQAIGINGALEHVGVGSKDDDSYQNIIRLILQDHKARVPAENLLLCIHYGGRVRLLKDSDKPFQLLRQYEDLALDPQLFLRRV